MKIKPAQSKTYLIFIQVCFLFLALTNTSYAATFEFSPPTNTFNRCDAQVEIIIDATAENANAADIEILFDPSTVTITDTDLVEPNIQIAEGNAFQYYWGNITDQANGRILLTAGSFPNEATTLNSRELFATIHFSYQNSSTVDFTIRYDGSGETLDSNIADSNTSDDILTSVTNGSYTFNLPDGCSTGPSQGRHDNVIVEYDELFATPIPESTTAAESLITEEPIFDYKKKEKIKNPDHPFWQQISTFLPQKSSPEVIQLGILSVCTIMQFFIILLVFLKLRKHKKYLPAYEKLIEAVGFEIKRKKLIKGKWDIDLEKN